MSADSVFKELEHWIEKLWSASTEVQTDQITRGPDAWMRNAACYNHQLLMQDAAVEGLRLWREARQVVVDHPTPKNVYALARCERLIRQWIASEPEPALTPDEQREALRKFEALLEQHKPAATH